MAHHYVPTVRTVTDIARDLVLMHLAGEDVLGVAVYRTAGRVAHMVRLPAWEVETGLEHLASKALVTRALDEWEVSRAQPQRYRWSKLATEEACKRFVDIRHRCEGPGCRAFTAGHYCSTTCAARHRKGVGDVCSLPVPVPDYRAGLKRRTR